MLTDVKDRAGGHCGEERSPIDYKSRAVCSMKTQDRGACGKQRPAQYAPDAR